MSFEPEKVHLFLDNFEQNKEKIAAFEGCTKLELWREKNSSTFFTYSHWENELFLENYRNSELFKAVWNKTKIYFNQKPEAWTVQKIK